MEVAGARRRGGMGGGVPGVLDACAVPALPTLDGKPMGAQHDPTHRRVGRGLWPRRRHRVRPHDRDEPSRLGSNAQLGAVGRRGLPDVHVPALRSRRRLDVQRGPGILAREVDEGHVVNAKNLDRPFGLRAQPAQRLDPAGRSELPVGEDPPRIAHEQHDAVAPVGAWGRSGFPVDEGGGDGRPW